MTRYLIKIFAAALILSSCSKSAADIASGTYSGGNLTVFQDSMLFAKPDRAAVTVNEIDGGSITVRMDSLITGFPSVTATCTADKDGSGTDAKIHFSGTGEAGSSETIQVSGYTQNGRMSLNFTETVHSPAVRKWMLAEDDLGFPSVAFSIDFTYLSGFVTPDQVRSIVVPTTIKILCERSPYYDNVELTSGGKLGINYKEYHAESVLPRDSVDAFWEQNIAGIGTVGDFLGAGQKGLISYYLDGTSFGTSIPNSLIALANALLKIEQIPIQIPIPFAIPAILEADASALQLTICDDVLKPLLAAKRDTVSTTLKNLKYDEMPEIVRELITKDDFIWYKTLIWEVFEILVHKDSTYELTLRFIPYEKTLRPWES